jgi:hypothetical protein
VVLLRANGDFVIRVGLSKITAIQPQEVRSGN